MVSTDRDCQHGARPTVPGPWNPSRAGRGPGTVALPLAGDAVPARGDSGGPTALAFEVVLCPTAAVMMITAVTTARRFGPHGQLHSGHRNAQ